MVDQILIDGRSGTGKTQLANAIVAEHPHVQLVHMDDLYRGWDGLIAASQLVPSLLLGQPVRTWDWATSEKGDWLEIDPARPVIIEGVGALSRASRMLATYAIWLVQDDAVRRDRAVAREPGFAQHWEAWARQEEDFIAAEHPGFLADLVLDGLDLTDWRDHIDPARVGG